MENLETEVLIMLAMLDAVSSHCACDIVGLDVPDEKKGNQKLLLKFLLRKLNCEKVEASQDGVIRRLGERDKLLYTSLAYQIQNGRTAGFSEAEICAGVIKVIAPGNFLRSYLESKSFLTVDSLIQIMRSHFRKKDPLSTFTEMSNAVQSSIESPLDFVVCLLSMRENVLLLAKEEGCPFDKGLLQQLFLHAIWTGLKNNIWNDLHPTLENNKVSDEHLLQIVSEAVVNDSECHEKLSKEKRETKVNKIDNVDNPLLNEIRAMKLEHSTELAAFRAEILQIKGL